jgi:hypothetical protein
MQSSSCSTRYVLAGSEQQAYRDALTLKNGLSRKFREGKCKLLLHAASDAAAEAQRTAK